MCKHIKNTKDAILSQKQVNFLFLILTISLIKCLTLFLIIELFLTPNNQVGRFPDSFMYERIADNILAGHGFSLSIRAPFKPTMFKEPGYSFFIALTKLVSCGNINFVIFVQMLLNPLIAFLIYFIGREMFNERIARLSCLLVAFIPAYGEISFFIMPEFIFTILLLFTVLCLLKAIKSMRWIWFISAGFFLGFSCLFRNVVIILPLVYVIAILLKTRQDIKISLVFKLFTFILSVFLVTLPWMHRNCIKLELFSISRRGGELLSHQAAWAANFSSAEWKAYSLYLLSGNLAQKLYPQVIGKDLGEYEYRILMRTQYVDELLTKYKEGEVEKILIRQAIKDIMRHPLRFLLLSAIIYVQTFKYFESIALMLISGPGGLAWIISSARLFLFILGIVYALFAFIGMLYSRKSFGAFLIIMTILYFHTILTVIGIIPGGLQRHILPLTVFYSFFVVIAIERLKCAYS